MLSLFIISFAVLSAMGLRIYYAHKLRTKILGVIFILQNMVIDDYYNEIFFRDFKKDKTVTDNYDEFFGNDIDLMLDTVPKLKTMIFSFKRLNIQSWMDPDFYFRYSMFVKDDYDRLYLKYIQKTLVASIYDDHKI